MFCPTCLTGKTQTISIAVWIDQSSQVVDASLLFLSHSGAVSTIAVVFNFLHLTFGRKRSPHLKIPLFDPCSLCLIRESFLA